MLFAICFQNPSWSEFKDWKKILEPYYKMAGFMLGRTQYDKLNYEDDILKEVAKDFNSENTFEAVHVGVYFGDKENEMDPYFNGLGPNRKGCTECAGLIKHLHILCNDILNRTSSGNGAINDAVIQFSNPYLPYGGVGESGMGRYHEKIKPS